jgi:hypothetical protein
MQASKVARRLLNWTKTQARELFTSEKFNPARRDILKRGTIVGTAILLGGATNMFFGCGSDDLPPTDDNCKMIDAFEDGNLTSEFTGMTWVAMEGSSISTVNGLLRIEGRRNAQRLIGAVLQYDPRQPIDAQSYDTILADIRAGKVSDPYAPFTGKVTLEIEGFTNTGGSILSADFEGFAPGEFITRHQVYSAPEVDPDYTIRFLSHVRIYLEIPDDEAYFVEVDNLKLCLTGWPFIS